MKRPILAWREEPEPPPPPYDGPFCVIRPEAEGALYTVTIEPPLPCGTGAPLTFATKIGAWGKCLEWCAEHRLPLRNYCDGKVGSRSSEEKSL